MKMTSDNQCSYLCRCCLERCAKTRYHRDHWCYCSLRCRVRGLWRDVKFRAALRTGGR